MNSSSSLKQTKFLSFKLNSSILRGIHKKGYVHPTLIQSKCIPTILQGNDLIAMSRTGSGKSAAFLIPILSELKSHKINNYGVRALIITPTREIAIQIHNYIKKLAIYTNLRAFLLIGGDSIKNQFDSLGNNPDIIISTPGRLYYIAQESNLKLSNISFFVCDEADKLFEMGFAEHLNDIISKLSTNRQTLLFSATIPKALANFSKANLNDPVILRLDSEFKLSERLKMHFFTMKTEDKLAALIYILNNMVLDNESSIIFCSTRYLVEFVNTFLNKTGIPSRMLYGNMDQVLRRRNLKDFKENKYKILVSTDLAARGIDIISLNNAINFSFPAFSKLFIHRVGRVARGDMDGKAFSLVSTDEIPYMLDLFVNIGKINGKSFVYGGILKSVLEENQRFCKVVIEGNRELQILLDKSINANKIYKKTKCQPSISSIQKFKSLDFNKIHPLFSDLYSEKEKKMDMFQEAIRKYKSNKTIFEINLTKEKSNFMKDIRKKNIIHKFLSRKSNSNNEIHLKKDNSVKDDNIDNFIIDINNDEINNNDRKMNKYKKYDNINNYKQKMKKKWGILQTTQEENHDKNTIPKKENRNINRWGHPIKRKNIPNNPYQPNSNTKLHTVDYEMESRKRSFHKKKKRKEQHILKLKRIKSHKSTKKSLKPYNPTIYKNKFSKNRKKRSIK